MVRKKSDLKMQDNLLKTDYSAGYGWYGALLRTTHILFRYLQFVDEVRLVFKVYALRNTHAYSYHLYRHGAFNFR